MASKDIENIDAEKQEELEDITTCCICTDVYTDPKALPCIHTFCMNCIQETGIKTHKGPGDVMPCPICRRMFKIPTEGFSGLPKHFFIERLIQLSKISVSKSLCSLCQQEIEETQPTGTEIPVAEAHCIDCKHSFCAECCGQHRNFKLTRNHRLIPINEYERDHNGSADHAPLACEFHEQKVLDVFCADCRTVECAICFIEKHKNHEGSDVNSCVDDFCKQIENNIEAVNECIAKAQLKKEELAKEKEEMQQGMESLQCDVEKRKDEIMHLAVEHASSLLDGLCSEGQNRLKELQMATDDIDTYLSKLDGYKTSCRRLINERSASYICREVTDLLAKATQLQQQCQSVIETGINDFKFYFRQSELEEFLEEDCGNLIGRIEEGDLEMKESNEEMQVAEASDEMLRNETEELREESASRIHDTHRPILEGDLLSIDLESMDSSEQMQMAVQRDEMLRYETEEPREESPRYTDDEQSVKLKRELENNKEVTNSLRFNNDKLKQELNTHLATIKSLEISNANEKANCKTDTEKLKQDLEDNKAGTDTLQVLNDKLKQEIDAQKSTIKSLQDSNASEKADYESQIDNLKQELEDNKTAINELKASNNNLSQELDAEKSNNDSLQASSDSVIANYESQQENLKQELEENKAGMNALQVINDQLNKELQAEKTEKNSLQSNHAQVVEDLKMCQATVRSLETKVDKLQKELVKSEAGHLTNDEIKRRIRRLYVQFISDVDPDLLGDHLKQDNVLSIDIWQKITARKDTAKEKCRSVLDYLLTCDHPSSFLVVLQALQKIDHHILETINKEVPGHTCRTANKEVVYDQRLQQQLSKYEEQQRIDKCRIDELTQKLKAIEEKKVTQTANIS